MVLKETKWVLFRSLSGPSQVSLSSLSGSGLSQVSLSLSTQTEPKIPSGTFNDTDTYIRTWRAASLQLKIWLVVLGYHVNNKTQYLKAPTI